MQITLIDGGIVAPEGFFASAVSCGLKENGMKDLALICSDEPAAAAGALSECTILSNSIKLTMQNLTNGYANAIIINTGCGNICNGEKGFIDAKAVCARAAELIDCEPTDILFASLGKAGTYLPIDTFIESMDDLVGNMSEDGNSDALNAIMTNDSKAKELASSFDIQGKTVKIGLMAKGTASVHPDNGGIVFVITTDLNISKRLLQTALNTAINRTANRISVNGKLKSCDLALALANGQADNEGITTNDLYYDRFVNVLTYMCLQLSKDILKDSDKKIKLIDVTIGGSSSEENAEHVATALSASHSFCEDISNNKACISSLINAISRCGAVFNPALLNITIGTLPVVCNGAKSEYDAAAYQAAIEKDFALTINFNDGSSTYRFFMGA